MKQYLPLLLILVLFPTISSLDINMKSEFQQGETLIATVSGTFTQPPLEKNIVFYRGHVEVPIESELARIDDVYYIYALLPENNANYSIEIQGVNYVQGSQNIEANLTKEFIILNETADFSVDKAHVVTDDNFFLEVQNLQASDITIELSSTTLKGDEEEFESYADSLTLKSGEKKKIEFELYSIQPVTLKEITLKSENLEYKIPIYIFDNNAKRDIDNEDVIDLDEVNNIDDEDNGEIIDSTDNSYVPVSSQTCNELGGVVCSGDETCEGNSTNAKDNTCCSGECKANEPSSTGELIGWGIIIIVIGVAFWFFKFKYKGAKKEINFLGGKK